MSEFVREYFYTVDREGVLYHDGTVLLDERFLQQFFRRLRRDEKAHYPDYPFVSPCAGELNFVRAEETVVVFRRMTPAGELEYAAGLTVPFDPGELRVSEKGVLYHPAPVGEVGMLRPALAVELADRMREREGVFEFVTDHGAWQIRRL